MIYKSLVVLGLVMVFSLAACAPTSTTISTQQPNVIEASATPSVAAASPGISATAAPASTDPATLTPMPVATSRGPNLEATDPSTVQLASGGLQLVEFFRFT